MMNDLSIAQPDRERGTGILSATVRIRPVANLFSAKGALSSLAWGNRPRHALLSQVNRVFSAGGFLIAQILGRRPRLAMKQRLWRDTFPKRCEDASHSKALRAKWARELCSVSRKLWECACVLASL